MHLARVSSYRILVLGYPNVFHHHVGQPVTSDKKAWQHQLMLRIFNFIAIKQRACIRRAHIRFRRYLCLFSARARVMPSPTTIPTTPYSWLGWFLITTTTSLLRSLRPCRCLSGYLRCSSLILYCTTILDLLAFARFSFGYHCQLLLKLRNPRCLKRVLVQHQLTTFYKLGEACPGCSRRSSKGLAYKLRLRSKLVSIAWSLRLPRRSWEEGFWRGTQPYFKAIRHHLRVDRDYP